MLLPLNSKLMPFSGHPTLHLVVIMQLVYAITTETYMELQNLQAQFEKMRALSSDEMDAYSEWQDLANFKQWITRNHKPLTSSADNFDHRHDPMPAHSDDDLPF